MRGNNPGVSCALESMHVLMHVLDGAQTCDHCRQKVSPDRLHTAAVPEEMRGASPSRVARQASPSPERLRQALRWNVARPVPARALPGGQPPPTMARPLPEAHRG